MDNVFAFREGSTFLHKRLHPLTKMIVFFLVVFIAGLWLDVRYIAPLLIIGFILAYVAKVPPKLFLFIVIALALTWFPTLRSTVAQSRPEYFKVLDPTWASTGILTINVPFLGLDRLGLTYGSLYWLAGRVCRFAGVVTWAIVLLYTTSISDITSTLYSLKVGHFSSPLKTKEGWFIFKLIGISFEAPPNANDNNYNRTIINVIRMRKSRIFGMKYLDKFYKNRKATIDSTLFLKLTGKISSILTQKESNHDFGRDNNLFLNEGNIMEILKDFGDAVNNGDIVHIEKSPIKLKEYLFSLIVYPFLIKDPSLRPVAYNLMENLNKYIQYKFLSDEGFKEELQNIPDVKEDINIWRDNYLAKMLKNTFRDSINVTDEDVKNYYKEHKEFEKVNILEILNDNLEVIETVFKELKAGKDFRELATKYTQRAWTKDRGGEFGYMPVSELGEIGKFAARLKMNHVYGPIRTDSGYSVIKLIGRKTDSTRTEADFEAVKDQIKDDMLSKEFNKKFFEYIAKLAEKYKYSINEENLKSVKVLDIPMFTFKYIGFGGRIAAMPFMDAWYDWVNFLKGKPSIVP